MLLLIIVLSQTTLFNLKKGVSKKKIIPVINENRLDFVTCVLFSNYKVQNYKADY